MKNIIVVAILISFMLFQSCSLSRKCRDAAAMNQRQTEEIRLYRLESEGNQQKLNALEELVTNLRDENRRLESDFLLMSEEAQGMNDDFANIEFLEELSSGPGIPWDSKPYQVRDYLPVDVSDSVSQAVIGVNSGNLAFYCPRKVNYKEPFTALGFIADVISDDQVRKQLLERVREVERDPDRVKLSDDRMLIEKVQFYKLIELRLDQASNSAFEIKKIHLDDRQEVSEKMEGWQWKIIPVSKDQRQELVLKVIVYDADGKVDYAFNKTHFVDIEVRSFAFFHNMKMQFVENPEWAYSAVILPFITYLAGNYQRRRKEKAGKVKEAPAKGETV